MYFVRFIEHNEIYEFTTVKLPYNKLLFYEISV